VGGEPHETGAPPGTQGASAAGSPVRATLARVLLVLSFGSALASFIYEIAWIRMLSLVLGSATHSFELMLSAFILGLALGAYWIRARADALRDPAGVLAMVQWIMGILAIATLPVYIASFGWMAALLDTFRQTDQGYRGFVLARYALCLLVMLPATFCAGMTLPLITRMLMRARGPASGEGAIGAVYALNTLGSIAGVLLAGLVLMPLLGLKLLLVSGAVLDIALGLVLLIVRRGPGARDGMHVAALTIATACFIAFTTAYIPFDHELLSSGVYRYATIPRPGEFTVPFYEDGRTASVSIRRTRGGFITLSTNGKPDASMDAFWRDTSAAAAPRPLTQDIATQLLLPIITLAHRPGAREVAVIGEGSGMTSHVLLGSPSVERLVTIEIEPEMIHASRAFYPANRRVFEDGRAHFVLDDAKSYFAASGRRFDLILSEPSNPWVSGVSGLFTKEFYRHVRRQLAPGGVFGQWLHFYELDDRLAASVLAALDESFPSYEVFFTSNADILVVASAEPELPPPRWNVVNDPGIAHDLRRTLPLSPETFEAMRLGGRALLHPYLSLEATPNSDFAPVLDLGAERTRYLKERAAGFEGLGDARFDIAAALSGRRRGFGTARVPATPEIARVRALALGALVRTARALPLELGDSSGRRTPDDDLVQAVANVAAVERELATSRAPVDWHLWLDGVRDAERVLHGGTAGVADEGFYDRVRAYLRRTAAPAPVVASVDFLHGLAAWNFAEASRAGQVLVDARLRDSTNWLPVALTRDGLVVARLRLGDYPGARAAFRAFARDADESPFRARLLAAYLLEAERRNTIE
ncbi:MAG TPA: fused MFS/spermidine synthase, partial [Gemmatimonadaceae bacterium]|nr:fused MFS/spermidine synthase [Gemmatimonadaceae bacterium]